MDHLFVKPWFDKNIPMTRGKCYWLFNEWKRKSFGVGRGERVGVREQSKAADWTLSPFVPWFCFLQIFFFFSFFLSFHPKQIFWYPNRPHLYIFSLPAEQKKHVRFVSFPWRSPFPRPPRLLRLSHHAISNFLCIHLCT